MKPTGAIERLFRLGVTESLKGEGFAKKGVNFYRQFNDPLALRSAHLDQGGGSLRQGPSQDQCGHQYVL